MGLKIFFAFLFILFVIVLLAIYWFLPFGQEIDFNIKQKNYNFSLSGESGMQFYSRMRYPDSKISYHIYGCPLQKTNDMENAFDILADSTLLSFYKVNSNEEISVICDQKQQFEEGMFIAGEGGPTNITKTDNYNVILHGKILLIRESNCERPNIAIHELLHALGFKHSSNPDNIMYNFSKCGQIIGEDTLDVIDELYSTPSYADLSFENASAFMRGRYLNINMSIRNDGLKESGDIPIIIFADEKTVKKMDLKPLNIGYGVSISLTNILITQFRVEQIRILINSSFDELNKENNEILLEIQKES